MRNSLSKVPVTLSAIWIYPLKSARGISVSEAELTDRGLAYDRRWMLVSPEGNFLTQRELPQMAKLQVELQSEGLLCHFQGNSCRVPFLNVAPTEKMIRVWRYQGEAWCYPPAINDWFSNQLQVPCELVFMPDSQQRETNPLFAPGKQVSFADGYPYLLAHQASLDDLNTHLQIQGSAPVTLERFRPNLILASEASAYAEDDWQTLSLEGANSPGFQWDIVKACERCVIVNTDPHTGVRRSEILKTLAKTHLRHQKVIFGQNACARQSQGTLHVGMKGFAHGSPS